MSVCSTRIRPVAASNPQAAPRAQPVPRAVPHRLAKATSHTLRKLQAGTPPLPGLAGLRRPTPCWAQATGEHRHESFSHGLFMDTIDYHKRINVHPAVEGLRGDKVASARIYWRMLVDKLAFHTALESLLDRHKSEALLEPFRAPVLARSARLRQDLRALASKSHVHMPKPAWASQAARDYIEALDFAARRDPRALAAHAWLHYLGDMHGGQMMQDRLAQRHGEDTVSCFGFTAPVEDLRKLYGRALDMPLSAYEQRLLREQAVEVYEHSLRMHDLWLNP